ncbi:MAG: T9SS type A sorting domain-containing protein [Bacteroidetes bacterium]|nr:T9SS type A sorting domain-containing protein [Bacteroidota bacterium]
MRQLSIAILSIFISTIVAAQLPQKQWDVIYGGMDEDHLRAVKQTQDGGYVLAGWSRSGKTGNKKETKQGEIDYWIVKTDSTGDDVYQKVYGGTLDDELTLFLETNDGHFLIGGFSESGANGTKTQVSKGGLDFWIVRTDENGNQLWDRVYGGSDNDKLFSAQKTTDGGFILGGYSKSGISGDKSQPSQGGNDYWIVKIDATGSKQWDARFGGSSEDKLTSIIQTSDGGFLLGGISNSGISGDKSQPKLGVDDFWIVKTDANGIKQWDKTFGGADDDQLEEVVEADNGDFLLAGSSNSGISGDKTQSSRGGYDYWLVKTNATGNKLYDSRFGGSGNEFLTDVIRTSDGRFMLAGYSLSNLEGDKTQDQRDGVARADYWIVKIDTNCFKQYDLRFGSWAYDECFAIEQTSDGGFLLGGYCDLTDLTDPNGDITDHGYEEGDYCIIKTDGGGTGDYIVTPIVTPLTYWPGDSITIRYEGSGTFSDGNVFTVQLSDEQGSFTSPLDIGSISSKQFGEISAIIPNPITLGNHYRVRVISSQDSVASIQNNEDISINNYKAVSREWDKTFGTVSYHDYTGEAIQASDGGYIIGGYAWGGINGDKTQPGWGGTDYWLIKVDSNGNKLWDVDFGGTEDDYLRSLQATSDGGCIAAGASDSPISGTKSGAKIGGYDFWLVKINADGTKDWDITLGGGADEELAEIRQTDDGGYIVGGSSASGANGDKSESSQGSNDYWIVKIDASGIKQWDKRFGGPASDILHGIQQTPDHGFILGGVSYSGVGGNKTQVNYGGADYWLVKINTDGVQEWDQTFGGESDDLLHSVITTPDGGFLAGGISGSGISGNKSQANWGGVDFWAVKTNAVGMKEWDRTYGGSFDERGEGEIHGVVNNFTDGGYLFACNSISQITGTKTQTCYGYDDFWLLKTDASGAKQWDVRLGGTGGDVLASVAVTNDGGLLLAGKSGSDISGDKTENLRGQSDYWMLKTNDGFLESLNCDIPPNGFTSKIKSTSAKMNWDVVPTAQTYSVRYRKTGAVPWTKTTAQLNYKKLTGLLPNTQYDWAVKSVCDQGSLSSDWSETKTFTTKPLRLENDVEEIAFNVFPNPSAGVFTVDLTVNDEETMQVKIEVLNLFGQIIHLDNGEIENGKLVKEIKMGNAPDGIYLVRLFINGQVYTSQISLQK